LAVNSIEDFTVCGTVVERKEAGNVVFSLKNSLQARSRNSVEKFFGFLLIFRETNLTLPYSWVILLV